MTPNRELIEALAHSAADNMYEVVLARVNSLKAKYQWTFEETIEIVDLVYDIRKMAVDSALDATNIALAEALGQKAVEL